MLASPPRTRGATDRLGVGLVALRNPAFCLTVLGDAHDREPAIEVLRDAFDMLAEDFEEERFYVTIRRAFWAAPEGSATAGGAGADRKAGVLSEHDGLPAVRRRHRRRQRGGASHQGAGAATYTPGVLSGVGSFGGLFALDGVDRRSRAGRERRRRRHQAEGRVHGRRARHDRRRSRQSLRERHPRPGRASRCSFSTIWPPAGCRRTSPSRSSRGMARACRENGCALLGGETAEMPGFYADGEYDVAGFIVGLVSRATDHRRHAAIVAGDVLIALPSSGLHTNGYSLARRIAFDDARAEASTATSTSSATTVGDGAAAAASVVPAAGRAAARRRLDQRAWRTSPAAASPRTCRARCRTGWSFTLDRASWTVPPLFAWLQRAGGIDDAEMFRAFNMGVGLILVCDSRGADTALASLHAAGEPAWSLGTVV